MSFDKAILAELTVALAETVIRDRFQAREKRELLEEEFDERAIASIICTTPLKLLDLRTSGASRLGVPTNAVRGKAQLSGRRFSQRLNDTSDFDGIAYMSRITNAECVAVYDRTVPLKLDPNCPVEDLVRLAQLVPALKALNVSLIKRTVI